MTAAQVARTARSDPFGLVAAVREGRLDKRTAARALRERADAVQVDAVREERDNGSSHKSENLRSEADRLRAMADGIVAAPPAAETRIQPSMRAVSPDRAPKKHTPGGWVRVTSEESKQKVVDQFRNSMMNNLGIYERAKGPLTPEQDAKFRRLLEEHAAEIEQHDYDIYSNGGHTISVAADAPVTEPQLRQLWAALDDLIQTGTLDRPVSLHIQSDKAMKALTSEGGEVPFFAPVGMADLGNQSVIYMNAADVGAGRRERIALRGSGFNMPSREQTSEVLYYLAHEWGHLVDPVHRESTVDDPDHMHAEHSGHFGTYGQSSALEGFAEAFAEWFNSRGRSSNPSVRAYAGRYGWKTPKHWEQP